MSYVNIVRDFRRDLVPKLSSTLTSAAGATMTSLLQALRRYRQYVEDAFPQQLDVALTLEQLTGDAVLSMNPDQWIDGVASTVCDITEQSADALKETIMAHGAPRIFSSSIGPGYTDSSLCLQIGLSNGLYLIIGYMSHQLFKYWFDYFLVRKNPLSDEPEVLSSGVFLRSSLRPHPPGEGDDALDWHFKPMPWRNVKSGLSFLDVYNETSENAQLSDTIGKVCNGLSSGEASLSWLQQLKSETLSRYTAISTFLKQVIDGFIRGGLKGAIMAVIFWFKTGSTYSTTEDGYFAFSDNSTLVPKLYLVNILQTVFSVVSAVVSSIVMLFSRVLGIVLQTVGTVVWSLAGFLSYDESDTRARMNLMDRAPVPWNPWVGMHLQTATHSQSPLAQLLRQGLVIVEIPFGFLLCGQRGPAAFGSVPINVEFHPTVMNTSDYNINWNNKNATFISKLFNISSNAADPRDGTWTFAGRTDVPVELLLSGLASRAQTSGTTPNGANGAPLGRVGDYICRTNALYTTGLALMYLYLIDLRYNSITTISLPTIQQDRSGYSIITSSGSPIIDQACLLLTQGSSLNLSWITGDDDHYPLNNVPSWSDIAQRGIIDLTDSGLLYTYSPLMYLIDHDPQGLTTDDTYLLPGSMTLVEPGDQFALTFPQYDSRSFWTIVGWTIAAVAVAAITATALTFVANRKLQSIRARNAAKVEAAWSELTEDPTNKDLAISYRKAVKRNNLFASVFGGEKFSVENYWGEVDSSSSSSQFVTDLIEQDQEAPTIETVVKLIAG